MGGSILRYVQNRLQYKNIQAIKKYVGFSTAVQRLPVSIAALNELEMIGTTVAGFALHSLWNEPYGCTILFVAVSKSDV